MLPTFIQIVGSVSPPPHLGNTGYGAEVTEGGLISLISNIIKLVMAVGGLWAFINIILAGLAYIQSGDKPEEIQKAGQRIYMSVIGLVIMLGSFLLTGLISWLLYGDATYILNPQIYGPGN